MGLKFHLIPIPRLGISFGSETDTQSFLALILIPSTFPTGDLNRESQGFYSGARELGTYLWFFYHVNQ